MLPFDIRHPSRDAALYFHRKRQPVADLETANLAVVNTTDILKQIRHRLFQLEVSQTDRRLAVSRTKPENLNQRRRRIQDNGAATDLDGFQVTEAKPVKNRN